MPGATRAFTIDPNLCRGCGHCAGLAGAYCVAMDGAVARPRAAVAPGLLDLLVAGCPHGALAPATDSARIIPFPGAPRPILQYFEKMKGGGECPPAAEAQDIAWSWLGAFLGIAAVAYLNFRVLARADMVLLIGSFGASAVLVYGAVKSPLAQPRNLLGGHVLSALIGVASWQLLHPAPWLAAAIAVSVSIAAMHATRTLHPPGGATALIAVIGGAKVHALGFLYAFAPVGLGAAIMLAVALIVNNIPRSRKYPEFWL